MRYVSSHMDGSYDGSYFLISFGALNFAGYFSPRIIGPKHWGPTRLREPLGSLLRQLVRVCLRASSWRARQIWLLMMWVHASTGCPLAATMLFVGRSRPPR